MRLPAPPKTIRDPAVKSWMDQVSRLIEYHGPVEAISGWVADDLQTADIGRIPDNCTVIGAQLHVTEAFDSDGTDQIECGWTADQNAIFTLTDVSTTGVKSLTLGVNEGFNSTQQDVQAYYANGGSEPTTGKALVTVWFVRTEEEIS